MNEPKSSDLVRQAADLRARESAAGGPSALVAHLVDGVRQQRRLLHIVAGLVMATVVLVIGMIFVGYHVYRNTVSVRTACAASNDFLKRDHGLWIYVLKLPNAPGLTAAQIAAQNQNEAKLKAQLDIAFATRDCDPGRA